MNVGEEEGEENDEDDEDDEEERDDDGGYKWNSCRRTPTFTGIPSASCGGKYIALQEHEHRTPGSHAR